MSVREYRGRVTAAPNNYEVDLKLYLYADAGFGIHAYMGVLKQRFPLLMERQASIDVPRYLAQYVMDREIVIRVFKSLDPHIPYAVELIDPNTGINHNVQILEM